MSRLPLLAVAAALAVALAGCSGFGREEGSRCTEGLRVHEWFVQPDGTLGIRKPADEALVDVPGFRNAFIEDDPAPMLSPRLDEGIRIVGNVSLDLWVRSNGGPAPILFGGEPGEGYHLFLQFGSHRALAPGYLVEYGPTLPLPGTVAAYDRSFAATPGGFIVEKGDRLRLLVTSLVVEEQGRGHQVLAGGARASSVSFLAECVPANEWVQQDADVVDISLPGHQGLLTGAVPSTEGVNVEYASLDVAPNIGRVTLRLQADMAKPVKDDVDMMIVDPSGAPLWNGGSPATDETIILYRTNLDALGGGPFLVRIDSYSGTGYTGTLTTVLDRSA